MSTTGRLSIAACALISMCLLASYSVIGAAQKPTETNEDWKLVSSYGFPVWIALNDVSDDAPSSRNIYLFIDGKDFTEANIRRVFTSLAAEFRMPGELWMYAYSDRALVQRAIDDSNGPTFCASYDGSPEGRRSSRNHAIRSQPRRIGYYHAQYLRVSEGREEMEFRPYPAQEHVIRIDLGTNTRVSDRDSDNDLLKAAELGEVARVSHLLEQGAPVNTTDRYGNTALLMAARQGELDVVRALLEKGADVNRRNRYGFSPLMAAAIDGGAEIVQLLLQRGADVNGRQGDHLDNLDDTILMLASLHGHAAIVENLIAKGAKVDERNRFGETALMQAALARFPEVVKLLVSQGAEINATDVDGRTALMLSGDDKETAGMLLNLGADYKGRDKEGMTALMLATSHSESLKVEALISAGAGKESIEAAKSYIALHVSVKDRYPRDKEEKGYRILTEICIEMGLWNEAIEASKEAIDVLGDKAHLRAQLGFTYLAVGDRESAWAQYRILEDRATKEQDENEVKHYRDWADSLLQELKEQAR